MSHGPDDPGGAPLLAPVEGDPGGVRRMAAGLGAEADLLGSLARTLRGLADPSTAVWSSPAGLRFARRASVAPPVVERVAHRYAVAAAALRRLADEQQRVQAEVVWAQRVHAQAWVPFIRAGELMGLAEASPDPAVRVTAAAHRAEMVAQGERVQLAVRRHAEAHEAWSAADRACAAVLHGLLDDGLADTWTYDLLTTTSSVAGQVSGPAAGLSLAPPLAWLRGVAAVSDGAALASDGVLYVAYGDGDLARLGLDVVSAGAGVLGPVLKQGARATNASAIAAARTRAERRALRVGHGDRLGAGLVATHPALARRLGLGSPVGMAPKPSARAIPAWSRPPLRPAALRTWLHEQTTVRVATAARVRFLDDLTAVLRTEGTSPRWFVAGTVASATAEGAGVGSTLRGRQLDARDQADLRESGERHR